MALIKRKILISREVLNTKSWTRSLEHEVLNTKSSTRYQFFFCKREVFQNTDFSLLKCQLTENEIDTACFVMIFQVSADEGMGK